MSTPAARSSDHGRAPPSATVKIGGSVRKERHYKSETTLLAIAPAGTAGAADIVVTVGYLSGTLAGGFTYLPPVDAALTFTVYNHTAAGSDRGPRRCRAARR